MAQKEYDKQVLKSAEKEQEAIQKFFSKYPKRNMERIYESLHKERQKHLKEFDIVYPDFLLLNVKERKEIYWEHFGMMDDPDYVEKTIRKIALYEQNGIYPGDNLIMTFETKKNPINQKSARLMIEHYLK